MDGFNPTNKCVWSGMQKTDSIFCSRFCREQGHPGFRVHIVPLMYGLSDELPLLLHIARRGDHHLERRCAVGHLKVLLRAG